MAKQELVTVQHLKNPAVKRQMTVASAKLNSNKWKIVGEPVVVEVKKKDVSPAAEKLAKVEPFNPLVNVADEEFATISEDKPKKVRKSKKVNPEENEVA